MVFFFSPKDTAKTVSRDRYINYHDMNKTRTAIPTLPSASKAKRWLALFLVATVMMAGYVFWDIISPISTSLRLPASEGGMGWSQAEYGFYAGSYSFFNVFLFMLFIGGVILDKCGVIFTGLLATGAMFLGATINYYAISHVSPDITVSATFTLFGLIPEQIKLQVIVASIGFALFGVGCDITGITVSKIITQWFTGYELASAMGIQMAMARLGTASALSFSPMIAQAWGLSMPILVGAIILAIALALFIAYCFMHRDLNRKLSAFRHKKADGLQNLDDGFHLRDISQVLRNPGFWLIALVCVFFYSSLRPFMKFATDLMVNKYGVTETTAGWIVAVIPYGTIVLTPLFGALYDRWGKGITLIFVGCSILTLCHIVLALPMIHDTWFAIVAMILIGISFSLVPSALWPSVPKIVPIKYLGSAYSIIYYIQNIGLALVPMLIGKVNDADPSYTTGLVIFCAFGSATILATIILYAVDRKYNYGLQRANIISSK